MQQAQQSQQAKIAFTNDANNVICINVFTRTKLTIRRAKRIIKLKYKTEIRENNHLVVI